MNTWDETEEMCVHLHNEHCIMTVKIIFGELGISIDAWRDKFVDDEEVLIGTFSSTWDDFFDFLVDRTEQKEVE
jgi:hypothetical protein